MGELTRFEQVRQEQRKWQRRRRQRLFVLCLLVIVAVLIVSGTFAGVEPVGFVTDIVAANRSGDGFPTQWSGGVIQEMYRMGGSLGVVGTNHLTLYNPNGRAVLSAQHGFGNPLARSNGRYLLTFDRGGFGMRLDTLSGNEATYKMDDQILTADLAQNGLCCVATTTPDFLGQVTVFDRQMEKSLFTWKTSEMYINALAIANDGEHIAVAGLNGEGGQLISYIYLYQVAGQGETPDGKVSLPGEMVISCVFNAKRELQVITDKQALLLSPAGDVVRAVDFEGVPPTRFVNDDSGRVAVLQGDYRDRGGYVLTMMTNGLKTVERTQIPSLVEGMKIEGKKLYLLYDGGLGVYNDKLEPSGVLEHYEGYLFQPSGRYVYGLEEGAIVRRSLSGMV